MKHVQWFEFLMPEDPDGFLAMQKCLKDRFQRQPLKGSLKNSVELMLWLIGRDGFDFDYLSRIPNWSGISLEDLQNSISDLRQAKIITKLDKDKHPLKFRWIVDWSFFNKYIEMLKSIDPLVMIERARLAALQEQELLKR